MSIFKALDSYIVLIKKNACSYKGCVIYPNGVKFINN